MTRRLMAAASLALGLGLAAPARAQEPLQVIQPDADAALTCRQIADEAASLSANMSEEHGGGVFGRLGGVARSGAAMLIPGAGLAMAGVDVITAPGREREEAETAAQTFRWYYLNGLYAGRCGEPSAEAAVAPDGPAATPPRVVIRTPG